METERPQISVIMPLYNGAKFVGESIESVLAQTFGDFELIIVDDASTDASYSIACAYAEKESRIVVLRNTTNLGAAGARNRGLDAVRGRFITFMDADDLIAPERFARQMAFFEQHPQVDLCGSYYRMFGQIAIRQQTIKVPLTHDEIAVQFLSGCPFAMSSVMMRRDAFERSGVRFRRSMAEDYRFWVDLSAHLRMANIPEYLFFYRRWENQISTGQLDRQTHSAQLIQRELLHGKLGLTLSDTEAAAYTHCCLRVEPIAREDLAAFRCVIKRIYRANRRLGVYDPTILRKQLLRRYKLALQLFIPSWMAKIKKRTLRLELLIP